MQNCFDERGAVGDLGKKDPARLDFKLVLQVLLASTSIIGHQTLMTISLPQWKS